MFYFIGFFSVYYAFILVVGFEGKVVLGVETVFIIGGGVIIVGFVFVFSVEFSFLLEFLFSVLVGKFMFCSIFSRDIRRVSYYEGF